MSKGDFKQSLIRYVVPISDISTAISLLTEVYLEFGQHSSFWSWELVAAPKHPVKTSYFT